MVRCAQRDQVVVLVGAAFFSWIQVVNIDEGPVPTTGYHTAPTVSSQHSVEQARKAHLMSREHFTVDGTLIDACASLKSFKKKDSNATVNFHGEKRATRLTHR